MPSRDLQHFSISTGTMIRFFVVVLGIAGLYFVRDIIFSLVFAVIVASAIEPAVEWLKHYRIPHILGVILIYVGVAGIFFTASYLIFPLLFEEFRAVATSFPAFQEQVFSEIKRFGALPFASLLTEKPEMFFRVPSEYLGQLSGGVVDAASALFGGVFSFILVVVFSFYLAAQEKGIESFLRLVTPLAYEPYIADLWDRSQRKLGRWLRAQLLLGAIVGVMIFFGLTLLGVEHALFFAMLVGLFEIIPVVGPILAAIPAVVSTFLISPLLGVSTVALYLAVQQVESHVIVPVIMRKAVGLSPLVVVLALLVGGKLGGIFGILLAVPFTVIGAELLNDWDKKKRALIPE